MLLVYSQIYLQIGAYLDILKYCIVKTFNSIVSLK